MAAKIQVTLTVREPIPMDAVKDAIEKKFKASVMKEKLKGKKIIIWLLKAKKPELITEDNLAALFKKDFMKEKLHKIVKNIEVTPM